MENEYLAHHGIKGQKWGVRRFQNEDGTLTDAGKKRYLTEGNSKIGDSLSNRAEKRIAKMEKSKTRLGKAINNYGAFVNQYNANRAYDFANNKKFTKKVGSLIGNGALASLDDAAEDYYNRQAGYRTTKIGKKFSERSMYNAHEKGSAYERIHNSKNLTEYVRNTIDANFNTNIKSISGRVRTNGERAAINMLGGAIGVRGLDSAMDIAYGVNSVFGGKINERVNTTRSDLRNKAKIVS